MAAAGLHVVGQDEGEGVAVGPQAEDVQAGRAQPAQHGRGQGELEAHVAVFQRPAEGGANLLGRVVDLAQQRPHPGGQQRPGVGVVERLQPAQPVAFRAEEAFVERVGHQVGRRATGQGGRQFGGGLAQSALPDGGGHVAQGTPEGGGRVGGK